MEIEISKQEKDEIEIQLDNLTVAEILRTYVNKGGVEFAAWRREHPTKPILFRIQTSGGTVKKAVSDAISAVKKDMDKIVKGIKK
jgi:DNA-directed RNA polymerase subunit L